MVYIVTLGLVFYLYCNLSTSVIIQFAQGHHRLIGSLIHDTASLDNRLPVTRRGATG